MSFVSVDNAQFRLNGRRLRGFMVNFYGLIQNNYSTAQLDEYFDALKAAHIIGVRTWCFNKGGTPTDSAGFFRYQSGNALMFAEATYQSLDRVLASARKHGRKVSLVLSNNWPEFDSGGHKQRYVGWCNSIFGTSYDAFNKGDDFFLDSHIIQWKKDEIDHLAARVNTENGMAYTNDDTIFGFETINEGRFTSGTDSNADTATSYHYTSLASWHSTLSNYLKTVFPHHLVGTGSQAQFLTNFPNDPVHNGTYYGNDYTRIHQLSGIDYYDFHIYPLDDPPGYTLKAYGHRILNNSNPGRTRRGFLAQIDEYVTVAKDNAKPVVIGELGIDKRATVDTAVPTYPRWDFWRDFATDFFSRGGDIINIWHGSTDIFDDNNYNVLLDGSLHTAGNANDNANDDDAPLVALISRLNQECLYGRPESGARPLPGIRPSRL